MVPEPAPPHAVVLVVDDSHVARVAVEALLVRKGVAVVAAGACAEAGNVDPDELAAALLDLELADGTGVDVARQLRSRASSLPIAFLTSAPTSDLATEARELGPVFEKGPETDEAVAWAAAVCAPVGSGLGVASVSG